MSETIVVEPPGDSAEETKSTKTLSTNSSIDSIKSDNATRLRRLNMPMMYQMYESQYEDLRGTIYGPESPDFYPVQASETLRKALSGIDTNERAIIQTLLNHTNFQRQKILNAYEDMYERNLLEDIEEEAGGFFLELIVSLLKPAHNYDTHLLYKSISNRYGDRSIAVEIACTRTTKQLKVIRETYATEHKKSLEKDLGVKVEGLFGRMLTLLLTRSRDEQSKKLDEALVEKHANIIIKSPNGLEDVGKSVTLFEELFVTTSWRHIAAVLDRVDEAIKDEGKDVETLVRKNKNLHSEIRLMLLTIVRVSRNTQMYFAEKMRAAMTGDRPDHHTIIRICIDLADIAEEYKRRYHRGLEFDIQNTCSGEYLRLLSALIAGTHRDFHNNNSASISPSSPKTLTF